MTAIVTGSFDPVTYGHTDIIRRAAAIFGDVHVLVAVNPDKKYMFSATIRAEAIRACFDNENITVKSFDGMISDYAADLSGESVVVRGIRGSSDADYELQLCKAYRSMGIKDTVLLPCSDDVRGISSTAAREQLIRCGTSSLVPPQAMEVLKKEL